LTIPEERNGSKKLDSFFEPFLTWVDWVETRSQHYTLNSAEICPIKPNHLYLSLVPETCRGRR